MQEDQEGERDIGGDLCAGKDHQLTCRHTRPVAAFDALSNVNKRHLDQFFRTGYIERGSHYEDKSKKPTNQL